MALSDEKRFPLNPGCGCGSGADRVESGCTGARVDDWGHQGPVLDWVGLIGIERV